MVRSIALPEDLILGVIAFIVPEDLEDFAQNCQRTHSVAGSALEKHGQLIRHYSSLKRTESRTMSKTIKEVLVNPLIGRYIRNVGITYVGGNQRDFNPKYSVEDLEAFVRFLCKPGLLFDRIEL